MKDFNLQQWNEKRYLDEDLSPIPPKLLISIHKYLIKNLDDEAREAGLRMSTFESKYPTATSFYYDLEENGVLNQPED